MADQPPQQHFPDAPPLPDNGAPLNGPPNTRPKSAANAALPWALAAMVVLILAASGGLLAAWLVATMNAVPSPVSALATPTPTPLTSGGPSDGPTAQASDQPRHTPTPSPVRTQEPPPFVHVVQRGEYLQYIADLYGVTIQDIVALNDIRDANKIHPGKKLLIPGYGHQPSPSPKHG
ncbi:MAG: LysM peptidoglycan-binding domain-containing protein [Chloroflexota bacterium]